MPAWSRHGRWACSCFRVSPVRRSSRRSLPRAACRGWRLASSEPLCSAGQSSRTSGQARPMGLPPARQHRSRMDVDRCRLRTLALARTLSRRSRRSRSRGARTRRSRRGWDRGRCGRGVRGAHARVDRTLAPQLDCAAAARRRARLLVAARRHGRYRSRPAAGARGPEGSCAGRTRPSVPWDQAPVDRPAGHGFGFEWDGETQGDAVEARVASSELQAGSEAGNRFA